VLVVLLDTADQEFHAEQRLSAAGPSTEQSRTATREAASGDRVEAADAGGAFFQSIEHGISLSSDNMLIPDQFDADFRKHDFDAVECFADGHITFVVIIYHGIQFGVLLCVVRKYSSPVP
jgi:hypothetical protein